MALEHFYTASLERAADVEILDGAQRCVAAMHLGGVVIECLLKAILWDSLPENQQGVKEWKTDSNNPGHTTKRPGHDLLPILRAHPKLKELAKKDQFILKWIDDVQSPLGDFIDMRYLGQEIDPVHVEQTYKRWRKSYLSLLGWLRKAKTALLKRP